MPPATVRPSGVSAKASQTQSGARNAFEQGDQPGIGGWHQPHAGGEQHQRDRHLADAE
jgi:hypothetical protein